MKRTLISLLIACMAAGPWASASPQPPPIELWVMDADGTNQRNLAEDSDYDFVEGASWSPDSTRIATSGLTIVDVTTGSSVAAGPGRAPDWSINDEIVFVYQQPSENGSALHVMDGAGQGSRVLVDLPVAEFEPAWSPEGDRVAFVAGSDPAQVFVVDSDGSDLRQLTTVGSKYIAPTWSPDGRTIAFETFDSEIYLVNVDGTGERPVGGHDHSHQPTWCSDGTPYFTGQDANTVARISALSPSGQLSTITEGSSADCGPDGRLAFSRNGDVYVVDPGASGEPNLTASDDRSDFQARWSPDGAKIAFLSHADLPNPTPLPRDISVRARGHLVLRGRLDPAPAQHGCLSRVDIEKITQRGWKRFDSVRIDDDGRFRAEFPDRPGLYRAVSKRHYTPYTTYECLRAVSEIVRHRH